MPDTDMDMEYPAPVLGPAPVGPAPDPAPYSDPAPTLMELWTRAKAKSRSRCLTPKEKKIVLLAAAGKTNSAIAREVYVSEGTVKVYLSRVYLKLGIGVDVRGPRDWDPRVLLARMYWEMERTMGAEAKR